MEVTEGAGTDGTVIGEEIEGGIVYDLDTGGGRFGVLEAGATEGS